MQGYMAALNVTPPRIRIGYETVLTGGYILRHTRLETVAIEFVAGYGDEAADVPPNFIAAIMQTVAYFNEHRGDVEAELPAMIQAVLDPDRLMWV
jgi:hypothetical protein